MSKEHPDNELVEHPDNNLDNIRTIEMATVKQMAPEEFLLASSELRMASCELSFYFPVLAGYSVRSAERSASITG